MEEDERGKEMGKMDEWVVKKTEKSYLKTQRHLGSLVCLTHEGTTENASRLFAIADDGVFENIVVVVVVEIVVVVVAVVVEVVVVLELWPRNSTELMPL